MKLISHVLTREEMRVFINVALPSNDSFGFKPNRLLYHIRAATLTNLQVITTNRKEAQMHPKQGLQSKVGQLHKQGIL